MNIVGGKSNTTLRVVAVATNSYYSVKKTGDFCRATFNDYAAVADVMFDAVRNGRSSYSKEQRRAWVPQPCSGSQWNKRLGSQSVVVATQVDQIIGFMSLAANGYIDFAYVRPSAQGTGVFTKLFESIEELAQKQKETRLWVHASLKAQPAFKAMGFTITKEETVQIGNQEFQRFEMEKNIS